MTLSMPHYDRPFDETGWRGIPRLARAAEAAGVDRLLVVDHVVMGGDTSGYFYGGFAFPPQAPWLEPLAVLNAIAAVTERVRLATAVLLAPLRPVAVLAKSVATLDVLSAGRVDLGVGTGWQRAEYQASGLPFDRRGKLLDESMAACRELWTRSPASFRGDMVEFEDVYCEPRPVQSRVPVWFAGALNARSIRRIVGLGDGWLPEPDASADSIKERYPLLTKAWSEAGRPGRPGVQMRPRAQRNADGTIDLPATMAPVPEMVASGATDIRLNLLDLARPGADVEAQLKRGVAEFQRAIGS